MTDDADRINGNSFPLEHENWMWAKRTSPLQAIRMEIPFFVGAGPTMDRGEAGDWLVHNDATNQMQVVTAEAFDAEWELTHAPEAVEAEPPPPEAITDLPGAPLPEGADASDAAALEDENRRIRAELLAAEGHDPDAEDEREHVTDGGECWCNPTVIDVGGDS